MFQRLLSQIFLPVLIVAIGVGGLLWLSAKDAPPERVAKQPAPLLVETIELQPGVSDFQIRVGGNVVPQREATLSAEVAGMVIFKGDAVESGRHVQKGTSLLQIDPARFNLQVAELGSELKQADADLRRLEIDEEGTKALIQLAQREADIATSASKRLKSLAAKNAVTESELEAVERTELQARNALRVLFNVRDSIPIRRERLQAQQQLTELKQQQAQLNLDRTRIVAPFTGVITAVHVEQNNYVQTGDVLLKLEDTSAVEVECSLRMDDLYWLWNANGSDGKSYGLNNRDNPTAVSPTDPGLENVAGAARSEAPANAGNAFEVPAADATVICDIAGRKFHWKGKLSRYEGRGINRKTRTVACRIRVSEPVRAEATDGPPTLMRGMYVTVALNVSPRVRLLRIPTRAIQPDGQVWTVEDGLLRVHSVKPAKVLPDSVVVRADSTNLKAGDRVVITQLVTPFDGSRVREITTDRDADQDFTHGWQRGPTDEYHCHHPCVRAAIRGRKRPFGHGPIASIDLDTPPSHRNGAS